jgi:hypothetical protein
VTFTYRLHDTTGDDLGVIEHLAPNIEPGDVCSSRTGVRRSLRPGSRRTGGRLAALLEVAPTPLTSDDGIA